MTTNVNVMPIISVVMSVYNDAARVKTSVNSILKQTFTNFEFIIINDGSTDETGEILDRLAGQDARIRVIHQENTGLTKALIRGCKEARAEFIARQDSGDISLPLRLEKQYNFLKNHSDYVMVAVGARFLGPQDERLFDAIIPGDEIEQGLSILNVNKIKGPPHHGGTMFLREAYHRCGGYRPTFSVAQDMDLWLRLVEIGKFYGLDEILYEAKFEENSISIRKRKMQFVLGELAIKSANLRRNNKDETDLFNDFCVSNELNTFQNLHQEKAKLYYFVASCLRKNSNFLCLKYFFLFIKEKTLASLSDFSNIK